MFEATFSRDGTDIATVVEINAKVWDAVTASIAEISAEDYWRALARMARNWQSGASHGTDVIYLIRIEI